MQAGLSCLDLYKQVKVVLFEARCAKCLSSFAKPELGDFAYGQFLFTGERGTVHVYFEAIEHPVWACLQAAVPALSDREQGPLLQAACAHFADPIDGQRFHNDHVCPKCLSHDLASWEGRKLGEADIAVASFSRFLSLSEPDQLREAKAFYASFMARQRGAGEVELPPFRVLVETASIKFAARERFVHSRSEPRFFVVRLSFRNKEYAGGYRLEVQLLDEAGRAGAVLYLRELHQDFREHGYYVPACVIAAALRQPEGQGDYVDADGRSRRPF